MNSTNWACLALYGRRILLVLFLRNCSAHVMCLAESSGITDDSFRTRLRGWTFARSYRKNLAGGVRGYGAARMRVIYDSTDPSSPGGRDDHDDPSIPLAAEVYPGTSLRKLTLELSMPMIIRIGRKKDPLDLIRPSGMVRMTSLEKCESLLLLSITNMSNLVSTTLASDCDSSSWM